MNRAYHIIDRHDCDAVTDKNVIDVFMAGDYTRPIGKARAKKVNDVIMAEFRLIRSFSGFYPSGMFMSRVGIDNTQKKLVAIALSTAPNIDPKIKPLP